MAIYEVRAVARRRRRAGVREAQVPHQVHVRGRRQRGAVVRRRGHVRQVRAGVGEPAGRVRRQERRARSGDVEVAQRDRQPVPGQLGGRLLAGPVPEQRVRAVAERQAPPGTPLGRRQRGGRQVLQVAVRRARVEVRADPAVAHHRDQHPGPRVRHRVVQHRARHVRSPVLRVAAALARPVHDYLVGSDTPGSATGSAAGPRATSGEPRWPRRRGPRGARDPVRSAGASRLSDVGPERARRRRCGVPVRQTGPLRSPVTSASCRLRPTAMFHPRRM